MANISRLAHAEDKYLIHVRLQSTLVIDSRPCKNQVANGKRFDSI